MSPRPKGLLNKNVIQKELKSPKGVEMNLKVLRNPEMFCGTDFEKKSVNVCMGYSPGQEKLTSCPSENCKKYMQKPKVRYKYENEIQRGVKQIQMQIQA